MTRVADDDERASSVTTVVGTSDRTFDFGGRKWGRVPTADEAEQHVAAAVAAAKEGRVWDCGALDLRSYAQAGLAIDRVTRVGKPLANLTCLNLEFALEVTDEQVAALALASNGSLRSVNLNAAQNVGDDAVKALARSCSELTEIGLYWNVRVTDESVAMMCESCPALSKVNLSGCKRLTDVTARALSKLRHLVFLDVTRCMFSDAGLTAVVLSPAVSDNLAHLNLYAVSTYTDKSFACIGVLSRLTFLDVCGSQSLTDKALLEIADGCEKLTYLNLSWCNQLTDVGLCAVGERCTLLELLSVHGNRNVTSQFVSTLAAHNLGPRLKTLDVNGCVGVKEDRAALKALIPSLTTFVYHT